MTSTNRFAPSGQTHAPTWARRVAPIAFALALLTAAAKFSGQLAFIWPSLPVVRLWPDPDAQYRLQLGDVPYDLLRAADAVLPREASVLLVTPGHDVRHHEYTTFHRALYFLTPRPVWWMTPAPHDGTWESRWWISAPVTPETIRAIATEKRASYVLVYDLPESLSVGRQVAALGNGYLLQLDESICPPATQRVNPAFAGAAWPVRLISALATVFLLGSSALAVVARMGYRAQGIEAAALAWVLGAGLTSIGMLWLNALGVSLNGQIVMLTLLVVGGWVWNWKFRAAPTQCPKSTVSSRLRADFSDTSCGFALSLLLLSFLSLQIVFVTVMAVGRPLDVWDSWALWGMKARTIFLDGFISPAVYADPSRVITQLDYPLLMPLVEAWLYGWLGVPDDRLVGVVSLLFYLALAGICYSAVRRQGATQVFALGVAVVVASIPHVAELSGLVFADVPLAVFVTIAAVYVVEWLDDGPPGALAIAALAAGLMPWTKREGVVLLTVLCLATLSISRGVACNAHPRRAWFGVAALAFAAVLLSGSWWAFITWNGIINTAYLPVTLATCEANFGRLPTIAWMELTNLLSANWSYVWPLAGVLSLLERWAVPRAAGSTTRRTVDLLPATALLYLGVMSLTYVFSAFVPYQQHIASSVFRLIAQVVPLPVLWMAYRGIEQS